MTPTAPHTKNRRDFSYRAPWPGTTALAASISERPRKVKGSVTIWPDAPPRKHLHHLHHLRYLWGYQVAQASTVSTVSTLYILYTLYTLYRVSSLVHREFCKLCELLRVISPLAREGT